MHLSTAFKILNIVYCKIFAYQHKKDPARKILLNLSIKTPSIHIKIVCFTLLQAIQSWIALLIQILTLEVMEKEEGLFASHKK